MLKLFSTIISLAVLVSVAGSPITFDDSFNNEDGIFPKVVGGGEATPHEFPWLVSLQWKGGHFCSGVIISPTLVLTTASCSQLTIPFDCRIYAGLTLLNETDPELNPQLQMRTPQIFTVNPGYPSGPRGLGNDIALIRISAGAPLEFNEAVSAIPLPSPGQVASGLGVISGWGSGTEEEVELQNQMMKAAVPIVNDEECKGIYREDFDEESMICAGSLANGGVDFCNGDVGGPLLGRNEDGSVHLAGIASWGNGCGVPGYPSVYAEVVHFLDFINV